MTYPQTYPQTCAFIFGILVKLSKGFLGEVTRQSSPPVTLESPRTRKRFKKNARACVRTRGVATGGRGGIK